MNNLIVLYVDNDSVPSARVCRPGVTPAIVQGVLVIDPDTSPPAVLLSYHDINYAFFGGLLLDVFADHNGKLRDSKGRALFDAEPAADPRSPWSSIWYYAGTTGTTTQVGTISGTASWTSIAAAFNLPQRLP